MHIEISLLRLLSNIACTSTTSSRALSCIAELDRVLGKIDPSWQVRVFGSFGNGMCLNSSDLDITCNSDAMTSKPCLETLQQLRNLLQIHERFDMVELISSARVPLLKLKFDGVLDVDVSCNNMEPLRNTQLLRAYSDLSPAVCEVMMLMKTWAKAAYVVGAREGNLSSYSLTLMVIYFMQVDLRVGLPCLPVQDFDGSIGIPETARISWNLDMSLTALLALFFRFYAYEFRWGDEVVAVHIGSRTNRYELVHSELSDICFSRLHLADPFLVNRNLNCVLGIQNEHWFYQQLQTAAESFRLGGVPVGLKDPAMDAWTLQHARSTREKKRQTLEQENIEHTPSDTSVSDVFEGCHHADGAVVVGAPLGLGEPANDAWTRRHARSINAREEQALEQLDMEHIQSDTSASDVFEGCKHPTGADVVEAPVGLGDPANDAWTQRDTWSMDAKKEQELEQPDMVHFQSDASASDVFERCELVDGAVVVGAPPGLGDPTVDAWTLKDGLDIDAQERQARVDGAGLLFDPENPFRSSVSSFADGGTSSASTHCCVERERSIEDIDTMLGT
eukprot:TRINITY_DN15500_c0_g1_i2.p1 TRINITY_DN15500_c0_g1~~TRINITY_DN15500_c0_g1_i2.p1  ORF type:complete len:562 (+),score=89.79 TRINITY_DN15500_c0_g1_i2:53-1738(+)